MGVLKSKSHIAVLLFMSWTAWVCLPITLHVADNFWPQRWKWNENLAWTLDNMEVCFLLWPPAPGLSKAHNFSGVFFGTLPLEREFQLDSATFSILLPLASMPVCSEEMHLQKGGIGLWEKGKNRRTRFWQLWQKLCLGPRISPASEKKLVVRRTRRGFWPSPPPVMSSRRAWASRTVCQIGIV